MALLLHPCQPQVCSGGIACMSALFLYPVALNEPSTLWLLLHRSGWLHRGVPLDLVHVRIPREGRRSVVAEFSLDRPVFTILVNIKMPLWHVAVQPPDLIAQLSPFHSMFLP